MKVFKLEKIGLRRKDPFKIEDGFSKKNMDGCPSIIEVNGVYYGIEQPYFRYSQMEARGSHLYQASLLTHGTIIIPFSGSVESSNISTRRSSSPFPNISNFLQLPPTPYEIKRS